ncbi:carbohydrate esterase family 1 protein [Aureobasidium subglaciale EXF-2481]|uniref:feruloyl esterase n=1 Tax=Aureobasidium subglaciale (strain EXF-2481) TaxID=1043005 RepID=A0A074YQX7_AURSE|nr:carbohydrate esterase family 1 protein [Aureobasidium subglaciale EXF-2481]KER00129.1 carbohydrate esterase family 1 protein [Aureobasidium subglaciale EXF-2481]
MCTRSVIYRGAILHTFVLHLGGRARCPNFFLSLELQIVPQMTRMKVLTPFGNHNLPRVSSMTTNGSLDCWEDCRAARLKTNTLNFTTSGGAIRSYLLHVPTTYNIKTPAPVAFSYHGRGASPQEEQDISGMSNEAFNPSYLVVYPQGISLQWQGDPDAVGYDDVGFTLELLANLSSTLCIDSSRVYAAGKSNGGGFAANVLACDPQASRIFAAFAGASGAYYPGATDANCNGDVVPLTCNPGRYPIPLFTTHGDSDGVIPFQQLGAHYFVRGLGHTWPSIAAGSLFDATPLLLAFWNKWTLDTTPYNFANASVTTPTISSTTRVSSSATSTSSISAASLCPSANDQTVTDSNGNVYRVACSADNSIGSYSNAQASTSYLDCMTACDAAISAGCAGFTYVGGVNGQGSGTCYLKRSMGIYPAAGSNTISAVRLSGGSSVSNAPAASSSTSSTTSVGPGSLSAAPSASALSCPASNNQVYTHVANGAQFVIECGIDHSVGNMASTSVKNLEGCIAACATTTGCVDVSLSGSACHLKKSLGAVVNSGGILGARFVGFAPVTSTSSTSISTRFTLQLAQLSTPISMPWQMTVENLTCSCVVEDQQEVQLSPSPMSQTGQHVSKLAAATRAVLDSVTIKEPTLAMV